MKKITLLTIVALAAITATSCKKDRTCTCTITNSSGGGAVTATFMVTKVTKRGAAQGVCASGTETTTSGGSTSIQTTSCTIN